MNCPCATASFTVSLEPSGFVVLCQLAPETRPSMTFLSVGSHLCRWLPPDPFSRRRPCLKLVVVHLSAPKLSSIWMAGSPTGDFHPISSRPCWAYTIRLERADGRSWWGCQGYLPPLILVVSALGYRLRRVL